MDKVTGIPIEYLFLMIGALVTAIYAGIRSDLRALKRSAAKRDTLLIRICGKIGVDFIVDD